jgi:hypothetical protein
MPAANVVLTAQWTADDEVTYKVTYSGNGNTDGSAPVDPRAYRSGAVATILGPNDLARDDYDFLGWATSAGADTAAYNAGGSLTVTGNITLYAVWELDEHALTGTDITITAGPDDQIRLDAQTGNLFRDLANGNVPLGGFFASGSWSLLSLLLAMVAIIMSALLIIGAAAKRSAGFLRILTIIIGAIVPIAYFLLDDMSQSMVIINQYTLLIGVIFLVQVVMLILHKRRSRAGGYEDAGTAAGGKSPDYAV